MVNDVEAVQDLVVRADRADRLRVGWSVVATGIVLAVLSPAAGAVVILLRDRWRQSSSPGSPARMPRAATAALAPLRGELAAVAAEVAEAAPT